MERYPLLKIDRKKIRENTRAIVDLAGKSGMSLYGVTKATCGDPEIATAMLEGGAQGIADSRISNIKRMRKSGIDTSMMLLRTPMLSEIGDVVRFADISLNSESKVLKALSDEARRRNNRHKVAIMVEMGDLREGERIEKAADLLDLSLSLDGLELSGIGMNLACFAGVVPTRDKIDDFESYVMQQEDRLGMRFEMVTGGNSGNVPMLIDDPGKGRIDNLRVGEGILLGLETVNRKPIPGTSQDAFKVEGEVIEAKMKPSKPYGKVTQNAFGHTPEFEDIGEVSRLVIALGRQDTIPEDLEPEDGNLKLFDGSSDHMVLHDKEGKYNVGDTISFIPSYGALVSLFTSRYVKKRYV